MPHNPTFRLDTFGEVRQPGSVRTRYYNELLDRIKEIEILDTDIGSDEMVVTVDNHDGRAYENTELVHGRVWGISMGYEDDFGPWRYFTVRRITGFFTVKVTGYQLDTSVFHDEEKSKEWNVQAVVDAVGPGKPLPESLRSSIVELDGQLPAGVLRTEVVAGIVSQRKLSLPYQRDPFVTTVQGTGPTTDEVGFTPSPVGTRRISFDAGDAAQRVIQQNVNDAIRGFIAPATLAGDVLGAGPARDRIQVANASFTQDDLQTVGTVFSPTNPNNNTTYRVIQVVSSTEVVTDTVFVTETATGGPNDFTMAQPSLVKMLGGNFTNADQGRRFKIGPPVVNPTNANTFLIVNVPSPTSVQLGIVALPDVDAGLISEGNGFTGEVIGAGQDDDATQRTRDTRRDRRIKEQRKPKTDYRKMTYMYRVEKSIGRFDKIMQTNQTDAQFLTKLANALGYVWYIESFAKRWFNGTVIPEVHFRSRDFGQPISYEFDMDSEIVIDQPSVDFNILDIPDRSFSLGLDPILQRIFKESQAIDKTKRIFNESATPLRDLEKAFPTTSTDPKKAAEEADGLYKRFEEHLLKMKIKLIGDTTTVAKRMCILRNFIEPFANMPFYIQAIKYSLSPGSAFTMELHLMAKAVNYNTPSEAMYELRRLERVRRDLITKYKEAEANVRAKEVARLRHLSTLPVLRDVIQTSRGPNQQSGTVYEARAPVENPEVNELDPKVVRSEWQRLVGGGG